MSARGTIRSSRRWLLHHLNLPHCSSAPGSRYGALKRHFVFEDADIFVGWVERSDTHQYRQPPGGYRCAPPTLRALTGMHWLETGYT